MRVVLDTSAAVSAVLSRQGRAGTILVALETDRFISVISEPVLAEMEEVLSRPELIRSGASRLAARDLLQAVRKKADMVFVPGDVKLCRDPNDDHVVETALESTADVLVAEDKDLLEDRAVIDALSAAGVRVLTLAQFLRELEAQPDQTS